MASFTIVYVWLLLLFPALLRYAVQTFPRFFMSYVIERNIPSFLFVREFSSISFICSDVYFESPLQAISSAPIEAGRHVGVVNLTERETEEVTNEEKYPRKQR